MWNNNFADESLRHLRLVPKVKNLDLPKCVSDEGLKYLTFLPDLRMLSFPLGAPKITDAAIEHLAKISTLRWFAIHETQMTVAGALKLTVLLPHVEVILDGIRYP